MNEELRESELETPSLLELQEKEQEVLLEETNRLLELRRYAKLRGLLSEQNPADLALLLEELSEKEIPMVFRILPKELAAEVFVEMDSDNQEVLIHSFSDKELKEMMDELYLDDTVDIIEEMPATVVKRILRQTDPELRKRINEILNYPKDSAGSIMTIEFVDLKTEMTVEEAFARIRKVGVDKETIYTCYVTNNHRKLKGVVSVKSLLLARYEDTVGEIMEKDPISVTTMEDKEVVAMQFEKYDLLALPVVDGEGRLVGIVTVDDALDVLQEEATEDIEKMAAITPSDKPYLRVGAWETFLNRIPWLLLLMVSATFTGMIITTFEDALQRLVVLTAFIPMLMDTAGNSGSQASVTVIRSLALGDIHVSDVLRILWKEMRVSVLCGVVLGVANMLKMWLIDYLWLHTAGLTLSVMAVVSATLVVTVILAKAVGCTLPLLAKKLGFDPALMASPFITTIVDALALMVYFRIAMLALA